MNLKDAKLGNQYNIFIDTEKHLVDKPTEKTLVTTVIAIKKPTYDVCGKSIILGWKPDQERPVNIYRRFRTSHENDYISNQEPYTYGISVSRSMLISPQTIEAPDGQFCYKCHEYNKYAVPNQSNNTFICWSCRNN